MISGSVSSFADCSVLVGCDVVPDVSSGRFACIFQLKFLLN